MVKKTDFFKCSFLKLLVHLYFCWSSNFWHTWPVLSITSHFFYYLPIVIRCLRPCRMFCLKFIFVCIHVSFPGDWELILNMLLNHFIIFLTNNGDALCFWFSGETQCVVLWVVSLCQDITLSWWVDVQLEAVCYPPTRPHGVVSQKAVICIFSSYKCKCLSMFLYINADAVWPVLAIARGVLWIEECFQ